MSTPFLRARWRNLLFLNYLVPPERLRAWRPEGWELDLWRGQGALSLVARHNSEVRWGCRRVRPWGDYAQVDLRFLVRKGSERGVAYVAQHAPSWAVAAGTRTFFHCPCARAKVGHWDCVGRHGERRLAFSLRKGGHSLALGVVSDDLTGRAGELEDFFTRRDWAVGRTPKGRAVEFRTSHPEWRFHAPRELTVELDGAGLYGAEWAFLDEERPHSVLHAEGSLVEVGWREPRGTQVTEERTYWAMQSASAWRDNGLQR